MSPKNLILVLLTYLALDISSYRVEAGLSENLQKIAPDTQAEIDNLLNNLISIRNIPGLALSVIQNDGDLLLTKGYGFLNVEESLPVNSKTVFAIGSTTKSFTAIVCVKILSEKFPQLGELVLDTPIQKLAPNYGLILGDRYRTEYVTFRDLLGHLVCSLPDLTGIWVGAFESREELLYRQRYAGELCQFRTGFAYNNGLFTLAGDIIAHIADNGTTYEELVFDLFNQLGMRDSTFILESDDYNNIPGRAVPYYWKDGSLHRYNTEHLKVGTLVTAGGGILSTAEDMTKYMQFHLNLGKVNGIEIVPETVMQWLYRMTNPIGMGSFRGDGDVVDVFVAYALGLDIGTYDGWKRIGHRGNKPPFEAHMTLYPELKLGIFTAANGPGTIQFTDTPIGTVHNQIVDIVQGISRPKSQKPRVKLPQSHSQDLGSKLLPHKQPIKILPTETVGNYGSGLNGQININLKLNSSFVLQPYMIWGRWGRGWLYQTSTSEFRIEWDSDFWQMGWTNRNKEIASTLNFWDMDTIQYLEDGQHWTNNFIRNQTIDILPEIPWSPDSCSPEI